MRPIDEAAVSQIVEDAVRGRRVQAGALADVLERHRSGCGASTSSRAKHRSSTWIVGVLVSPVAMACVILAWRNPHSHPGRARESAAHPRVSSALTAERTAPSIVAG